ncbi:MAG TPA: urease accessory protein UreF [Burkholderiales bacterium]|nr:urease accessory protein UreF [Burkholderiales bacterium]
MDTNTDLRLARLLQLASPALPVGAFSYSQGLEAAIEAGIVRDAHSAAAWIGGMLEHSVGAFEAPVLLRLQQAWADDDAPAVGRWNAQFLASRETAELRAETVQMGYSLARLLGDLDAPIHALEEIAFPTAFARASAHWGIDPQAALLAYLWSWLENQVMAAVKAVPLGQTDGQRILFELAQRLPPIGQRAQALDEQAFSNFAPGLALLSARHETQYSRMFRS